MEILTEYDKYWASKGEYGKIRVERKIARKKVRAKKARKSHRCEQCNKLFPHPVEFVINPYYKDMYGSINMQRLCTDCYNSCCEDI